MKYYEDQGYADYKAGKSRSSFQQRGEMGSSWRRGYDKAAAEAVAEEAK